MELMELIQRRQSTRKFKDGDIPREDLEKILEAGRLAPSGKNEQNWHFVVIKNRGLKDKIAETIWEKNEAIAAKMDQKDEQKAQRFRKFCKNFTMFYLNAPVLIAVYSCDNPPDGYAELSLINAPQKDLNYLYSRNPSLMNIGAALENMNLRATELGYGACWMTGQNYAADEIEAVIRQETGFERENYYFALMMALGIPQDNLKSPGRKNLEEIATFID